jgi:hypothetical protein
MTPFLARLSFSKALSRRIRKTNRFNVNSLKHIKGFLSGIFRLADQQGYYEGANPVRDSLNSKMSFTVSAQGFAN